MTTRGQVRTLWPLPGGTGKYLDTLQWILDVARDKIRTEDLLTALVDQFGLQSEKAAISYLRVVHSLGLIEIVGQSTYETEPGRRYLETCDDSIVREALLSRIDGCSVIVDLMKSKGRPLQIGHIHELMVQQGYGHWQTDKQLRHRLRWLEEVGVVSRGRGTRPEYELVGVPVD